MALETDEEMPLSRHIEEMVQRLLYVMVVVAIGTIVTFVFSEDMIIAIWNNFLPGTEIRVYSPWGKILTQIKFSMMVGIALA
ncbi:MAG: twin-arginine translocase subunit TatC, partial [Halobacteria archaeon]|nr:twin-arginine translocase subunit TatC [Halobacteria archaeon]